MKKIQFTQSKSMSVIDIKKAFKATDTYDVAVNILRGNTDNAVIHVVQLSISGMKENAYPQFLVFDLDARKPIADTHQDQSYYVGYTTNMTEIELALLFAGDQTMSRFLGVDRVFANTNNDVNTFVRTFAETEVVVSTTEQAQALQRVRDANPYNAGVTEKSARSILPPLLKALGGKKMSGLQILDVGGGQGNIGQQLNHAGANCTVVDIDYNPNDRCSGVRSKLEYLYMYGASQKKQYDLVTCFSFSTAPVDAAAYVDVMSRFLKPDGTLVIGIYAQDYRPWLVPLQSTEKGHAKQKFGVDYVPPLPLMLRRLFAEVEVVRDDRNLQNCFMIVCRKPICSLEKKTKLKCFDGAVDGAVDPVAVMRFVLNHPETVRFSGSTVDVRNINNGFLFSPGFLRENAAEINSKFTPICSELAQEERLLFDKSAPMALNHDQIRGVRLAMTMTFDSEGKVRMDNAEKFCAALRGSVPNRHSSPAPSPEIARASANESSFFCNKVLPVVGVAAVAAAVMLGVGQ